MEYIFPNVKYCSIADDVKNNICKKKFDSTDVVIPPMICNDEAI